MLVVRATRFGEPEVLVAGEAPEPVPGPGEVVVGVSVADTLHLDTVIRRGAFPFAAVEPPYVPGGGVGGAVVAAGSGVDRGLVGRRVVARTGAGEPAAGTETVARRALRDTHTGGYAQRAFVPAAALVPVPETVDLPVATALVNDGMTAMLLVDEVRPRPGEWVLVTPAGGGLGNLLVQLAHAAGARVVGAARGEHKLARARQAGAEATVDYTRPGWTEEVRAVTGGNGADVVFDGVGGDIGRACLELTARGGRFVGHGAAGGEFTPAGAADGISAISLLDVRMPPGGERRLVERALTEVAAARISPLIGLTVPLERAAEAHAAIEARAVAGKSLLMVTELP